VQLIQDLHAEHELIEQVLGSLRTFVDQRLHGEGNPSDGARFVRFFRLFAGEFHHAREEHTLFAALRERADLPERGPIAALTADHRRLGALLTQLGELCAREAFDPPDAERLRALAVEYSHGLWHHIDAENSVLFPESESRLLKKGVRELPSRAMTGAERSAKADGEGLLARYPPLFDPTAVRGEGCVSCRAFGEDCGGLEREWWNEWEWEEFEDRLGSD
jgi:hemerythrin-like domain-containing protein